MESPWHFRYEFEADTDKPYTSPYSYHSFPEALRTGFSAAPRTVIAVHVGRPEDVVWARTLRTEWESGTVRGFPYPRGTKCADTCVRPTPAQAHCTVCHEPFGSISAFDRHRVDGWCRDPASRGLEQINGKWRRPMPVGTAQRWGEGGDDTDD
jgi:hypothetical protein